MRSDWSLTELAWMQLWQLTLVIVAVGVITTLCCRRRPHLAYALWMVVLVKGLTPPIWTSNLSAFGQLNEPPAPTWLIPDAMESSAIAGGDASPPIDEASRDVAAQAPRITRLVPTWSTLWATGAAAVALWAVVMMLRRNRLLAEADGEPAPNLSALMARAANQLAVRPAPRVLVSASNLGPAICGVLRPTLVLPSCVVEQATTDDLRPIIMHELVHLRRGDHFVAALQFVVQAVWWFHPLVWWANRRICRVRELCCDSETVRALDQPPRRYAQALVEVLEAKQRLRPVFGFPGVRPAEVTAHRVKEILTMSDRFLARTPISYWLAALLAGALLLPGGRLATQSEAEAAPAPADAKTPAAESKPAKPVLVLKYGDGKPDGKKSIAGAGEMIRFTLPKGQTNALKALRIHAARYGYPQPPKEDVEITILGEDMTEPIHAELVPYSLFKRQQQGRWTMVPFDEPVEVPQTFWVVLNFNAEATKGVYVSYDTKTKGQYSRIGFNDEDAKETEFKGDWMVQAVLAK